FISTTYFASGNKQYDAFFKPGWSWQKTIEYYEDGATLHKKWIADTNPNTNGDVVYEEYDTLGYLINYAQQNGDYATVTYWQSGNKEEEQFFNSEGILQKTRDYYDSSAGNLATETLSSSDSSGMTYYHYIDEDWNGQGYGRVDESESQTILNGRLIYTESNDLAYSGELSYSYSYYSDTGLLQTKNAYSDANCTTLVTAYNYYNDSTNRLASMIDFVTGVTYAYYNDSSGYVESKTLISPDLFGYVYYHYINESWDGRGYGRIDKAAEQATASGQFSYSYSYYSDATGRLQTISKYSTYDNYPQYLWLVYLVVTYTYYNDSTNRLASKETLVGQYTLLTYYNDQSGYIESESFAGPDSNGNVYYHYLNENWNNRGYGRVDKIKDLWWWAHIDFVLSYSYTYNNDSTGSLKTINLYSDDNWTVLVGTFDYSGGVSSILYPDGVTYTFYGSGRPEFVISPYIYDDATYIHFIDEDFDGTGYGRIDKKANTIYGTSSSYIYNDDSWLPTVSMFYRHADWTGLQTIRTIVSYRNVDGRYYDISLYHDSYTETGEYIGRSKTITEWGGGYLGGSLISMNIVTQVQEYCSYWEQQVSSLNNSNEDIPTDINPQQQQASILNASDEESLQVLLSILAGKGSWDENSLDTLESIITGKDSSTGLGLDLATRFEMANELFNGISLGPNLTPQGQRQILSVLLINGIGNTEAFGVSPAYMQVFAQQLALADPGAVNTTFIATYENSSGLWGKTGNIISWIGNTYFGTNEVTNYIISEVNLQFSNDPPADMALVAYSGGGDPSIQSANANPSWDVTSIVLVDAPIGFNTNITNPNVKNVIMITGLDDLLAGPVFTNKFNNNPQPLNTYNIALVGVGHTDFANQNPNNPTAVEVTQFTAYVTTLANNTVGLNDFLKRNMEGITYDPSLKMYEVDLSKVTYGN
ncbi:MAG: hypothetical protein WC738_00445, partial [Candidatus Omnitrophota bacterium]